MEKKHEPTFVDHVIGITGFAYANEVKELATRLGGGLPLLHAIIDHQYLTTAEACGFYASSQGFTFVDPMDSIITEDAVAAIPDVIARKACAIGIYIIDGVLTVAMAHPEDEALVRRLSGITRMPISPVFSLPRDIEHAILVQYCTEQTLAESLNLLAQSPLFNDPDLASEKLASLVDSSAIVSALEDIIYYAIRERTTDIHIEPHETRSRVRFRIDGKLREILTFSRKLNRTFISRLKINANLDIAETRFPQDGRFSLGSGDKKASFRLSTIPSQYGEKAVIRILPSTTRKSMITLDKMMMSQTILHPFERLIRNPNGLLFVTGPTGSGKTTTLYAAINEINVPDINISTIEDPIEIQLPGVTQTQVNSHIELKFSTVLRSLLRQDPDVLLVGEIRDKETAMIATEAALTGHIVFATLHTNTAAEAVVRLMEIGVASYMVAPSIIGVLAQRLAARICENCKETYFPDPEILQRYFSDEKLDAVPFYRGRGCTACRGTGHKGVIAFHELIVVTQEMRALIMSGSSAQEINIAATKVGYKPLRYDGLKKVLLGLTTIEEIESNTVMEM